VRPLWQAWDPTHPNEGAPHKKGQHLQRRCPLSVLFRMADAIESPVQPIENTADDRLARILTSARPPTRHYFDAK
jgi:hypothetical protein